MAGRVAQAAEWPAGGRPMSRPDRARSPDPPRATALGDGASCRAEPVRWHWSCRSQMAWPIETPSAWSRRTRLATCQRRRRAVLQRIETVVLQAERAGLSDVDRPAELADAPEVVLGTVLADDTAAA